MSKSHILSPMFYVTAQSLWVLRSHSNSKSVFMNSYKKLQLTKNNSNTPFITFFIDTNGIHIDHELSRSVINQPFVEHNEVKSS